MGIFPTPIVGPLNSVSQGTQGPVLFQGALAADGVSPGGW